MRVDLSPEGRGDNRGARFRKIAVGIAQHDMEGIRGASICSSALAADLILTIIDFRR